MLPFFLGDEGVQVIPQEIRAFHATMPVEHPEIGRLLPVSHVLWLREVQYDGHSVLVVLAHWPLVGGSGVGPDGAVTVFGVLGRLKVGDRHEYFGQRWVLVLINPHAPVLDAETLGLDEYLLADYLVDLLHRRLGLAARLVLVGILDCRGLGELQSFVGVVKLPLLVVLLTVEVGCALLGIFGGGWLGYFYFGVGIRFEGDAASHARKNWGDFR